MNTSDPTAARRRRSPRKPRAARRTAPQPAPASEPSTAAPSSSPASAVQERPRPARKRASRTADRSPAAPSGSTATPVASTPSVAAASGAADGTSRRGKGPSLSVSGVLRAHPRGFGFLVPDTPGDDIYVPSHLMKGMFDADRVEASVRSGESQAHRLRLLSRGRTSFVGSVSKDGKKVTMDPGVGSATLPLSGRCRPGDVIRFSLDGTAAKVVDVIGSESDPKAAAVRFLDRHRIPDGRPAGVTKEMRRGRSSNPLSPSRRDLRQQLVFTIDDDSSQDLDDALAARVESDGSVRLWIHIADVAEHVRPGSAVDRAAADVPTSVYLPQGVRHMLPDELGAQALSLLPGTERDTLCVELRLDTEGRPRGVDVYEARIRSQRRLNYATVADVIAGTKTGLPVEIVETVQVLRTAAARLDLWRAARGGLDSMHADQGRVPGTRNDDAAHQLIERLMVAANEAVAAWLSERGMPALWRAHDPLTAEQGLEIERVARGFGVVAALGSPVSARALAVTASQVPAGQAGAAFWDAVLGLLGRAYYTVEPSGHFGLASEGYLHFTSPLRRYPDLLVHRVVKAYLHGDRDAQAHRATLAAAAPVANDVFRRAALAERDATLYVGMSKLSAGQELSAFVVGRARGGVRLRLTESGVSAFLAEDLRPGHKVRVRVVSVDPLAGRLELKLL